MLKTIGISDFTQGDDKNEVIRSGDRNPSKSKKLKNAKSGIQTYIKATEEPTILTPGIREGFN